MDNEEAFKSELDMPLEYQAHQAKKWGMTLEEWQEDMRATEEIVRRDFEMIRNPPPPDRAEIEELIHDLRTKPGYFNFYSRLQGDPNLTVEQYIAMLEADLAELE
ncbi:hypothetical protein [Pelistega europaea]|uniref:Uncharacterized protein n=1 Tax=Pelistega europaea TaxID=106147 RepID=A0A7Y4LE45_9BURK|nr:hypothetical protein [Pelistega europaea]NOL50531.1 hypothetical protein [Pelistega europaea]